MATYTGSIATAKRLIRKFGGKCKVRRTTEGAPADDNKPWIPGAPTDVDHTAYAAFFNFDSGKIDGDIIRRGDMQVLMETSVNVVPTDNDLLVDPAGVVWSIKDVDILSPNRTENVLYTLQVRQ